MSEKTYNSSSTITVISKPQVKKKNNSSAYIHIVARVFLIVGLCVLLTSLLIDYENTDFIRSREFGKWGGTFTQAMNMAESFVVLLALIGNLAGHSSLYLAFFVIHVQFLCVLAVTSCALLTFYLNLERKDDPLLNLVIFHFCQFLLMIFVFLTAYRSFRRLKSDDEIYDDDRLLQP
ncbi:hypothetical protein M3Y98_01062600 [Aphelenchoides besseyi]|nr:hypothetical protein M3Y98_01062600 [Aphelenchoides besseyi]KAI6209686.1 hypothetical protein M3Y96_00247100 [Aphelenchoides besseyi]